MYTAQLKYLCTLSRPLARPIARNGRRLFAMPVISNVRTIDTSMFRNIIHYEKLHNVFIPRVRPPLEVAVVVEEVSRAEPSGIWCCVAKVVDLPSAVVGTRRPGMRPRPSTKLRKAAMTT